MRKHENCVAIYVWTLYGIERAATVNLGSTHNVADVDSQGTYPHSTVLAASVQDHVLSLSVHV